MIEKLLVEKLDEYSLKIKSLHLEIVKLNKQYNNTFDRDLRFEILDRKKKIKKIERKMINLLWNKITEIKLLKKYFTDLYEELTVDEYLKKAFDRIVWILKPIKKMSENEATETLEKIITKRKKTKGKFDLKNEDDKLKREGWLIIINSPLIEKYVHLFLNKYIKISKELKEVTEIFIPADSLGSKTSKKLKEIRKLKIKKMVCKRIYKQLLYSNLEYLIKLKNSKRLESGFANKEYLLIDKIQLNKIDENKWKTKMNELIG